MTLPRVYALLGWQEERIKREARDEARSNVGGGGGGGGGTSSSTTSSGSSTGAPKLTPLPKVTTDYYGSVANALLAYLSPQDQRSVGQDLATRYKEYVNYGTKTYPEAPTSITTEMKQQFLSANRGTQALNALNNIRSLYKKTPQQMGPGFTYLVEAASALARLGGTSNEAMTRAQYLEFSTTIGDILNRMKGNDSLAPYANLVQSFAAPGFSQGSISNISSRDGKTTFVAPSARLFE